MTTVDTKTAPRRSLTLGSIDELERELDRIDAAIQAGTIGHTGNWTPGQIGEHCAKFMRFSIDGFPTLAPGILRFFGRMFLLKKAMGPEPLPSGFKLPKQASVLLPSDSVTDATGIGELRMQVKRLQNGERMTQTSPLLGKLTHEQWVVLQLKHCAMHLSFITY
ncbi:MAG: hypothetical protein CMJ31_05135 [Phycisphaerae bacterium]|nr:hypothetical protein [Phycisphaerae bacterium]